MAAPNQQELDRIKKLLSDIDKMYQKIGDKNPFKNFDTKNISDAASSIGQLEAGLRGVKDRFDELTDGAQELYGAFKGIVNEIKNSNSSVKDSVKSYRTLGDLARKLRDDQKGIQELNSKELKSIQSKLQSEVQNLRLANEMAKREKASLDAKLRAGTITRTELKQRKELGLTVQANNKFLKESKGILEDMNTQVKERLEREKQIQKNLGLTGATLTGISKIPILGELIKSEKVLADSQEAASKKGSNRLKVAGAAVKSIGKSLGESLTDPLVVGGLLVKAFKFLLDLGFKVDKQIVAMSKSMAISKEEATIMRDRFVQIQNSQQSIFETTENLVNAQLELGKAFGATRGFTEQQLKDQVLLTKQMGLTEEEAAGLQQLSLSNKMSADAVLSATIKQTAALAKQTGIQLDNKKILGEVAKVSGQLRLQYKNNPALIAQAVVQTEKLGISLEKAKGIANSLLDFESSISAELEAELLTGKSINLEQARLLALNGKTAEAAAEISKQIGTSAEFSNMNVLQQDAYAKALGMSSDELANMLLYNENINKLGSSTKSQIEEQIRLAKEQGDTAKVQMLERSVGNEEQALATLKQIDAQERFNQAIEKLKSMLSDLVAGPAMGLANGLANMLSNTENIKQAFGGISKIIGGISLARMIGQTLALAGAQAIAAAGAITWASGITLGLGVAAIIAGMLAAKSGFDDISSSMGNKAQNAIPVKDAHIGSDGGLLVSGEKGTYQLDENDSVIAGTDLNKPSSGGSNSNVIVKGGETSLTIDGVTFARLVTPFIVEEMRKSNIKLQ